MAVDLGHVAANIVGQRDLLRNGLMHLPYVSLVNDQTLRLRDNAFMSCIRVDGLNALTSTDSELDGLKTAIANIVGQLDPSFTIYTHRISRKVDMTDGLAPLKANDFASAIDARWRAGLEGRELRDTTLTVSVVLSRRLRSGVSVFSRASKLMGRNTERDLERLDDTIRALRTIIGTDKTRVLTAGSGDLLGFLGSIQSGDERPIYPSGALTVLSDDVLTERVTFNDDGWALTEGPLGLRHGQIRAIRTYPARSWVTIFDDFALPCDFVIAQSFSPISNNVAVDKIQRLRDVMKATSDAREQAGEQLRGLHESVLSREASLGNHHMTISLIADSAEKVRQLMSELDSLAAGAGVTLAQDKLVVKAHYFAQFPGNLAARSRLNIISNDHFANFASLHRTPLGKDGDDVPWSTPIAVFPTSTGTPYRLSFHRKGSAMGEPSPGHTLMIGDTGSGKSLLAGFLLTQAQRTGARVFVFDYRRGLEMATRAMRGSYSIVESGSPSGLNPLHVETDAEGIEWLTSWLTRLLDPKDALTTVQTRAILDAVRRNAEAEPHLQTFDSFSRLFQSTDDGGTLQSLVEEWGANGRYSWVFGRTQEDTFSLDGDVMGFDLTQILDAQTDRERMAVLSYIFRRIERQMRDKKRTIILVDEAWKAIKDPYFGSVIEGWLATLRKSNAVVIMLTQTADQLARSQVGDRVFTFFPTKILFPDEKTSAADYRHLQLNEAEISLLTSRGLNRSFLLRDDTASVLLDADATCLGDYLHVLGGGPAGQSVVGTDFRDKPDFWRTAK
jgi:type IV secretion system protein VirB4